MIDVWNGCADDLEESGYKAKAVVDKVKSRRFLVRVKVGTGNASSIGTQLTSNHFETASNASTASLTAPRTLSTSNQNKKFFSRKR